MEKGATCQLAVGFSRVNIEGLADFWNGEFDVINDDAIPGSH